MLLTIDIGNTNLTFNPATGANYPFREVSRRPYPEWGFVNGEFMRGYANSHGIETSFTKRYGGRWQLMGTYTLSWIRDSEGKPCQIERGAGGIPICTELPFEIAPDIAEYTLAATDQRHRAVFNGIWQIAYGFQVSGLYFFGSGQRFATAYGGDALITGGTGGNPGLGSSAAGQRARPASVGGGATPRVGIEGDAIHRVDVRLQKRFALVGRANIDGLLEVFNLFNHSNYGSYTVLESNRNYGQPSFNPNVAYQPRMVQVGFRFVF